MQSRLPAAAWKDTLGQRRPALASHRLGRVAERNGFEAGSSPNAPPENPTPSRSQARPAGAVAVFPQMTDTDRDQAGHIRNRADTSSWRITGMELVCPENSQRRMY